MLILVSQIRKKFLLLFMSLNILLFFTTACTAPVGQPEPAATTPRENTRSAAKTPLPETPTQTAVPAADLEVNLVYPGKDNPLEKGQKTRFIISVRDAQGKTATEAQISLTVIDPDGDVLDVLSASAGAGEVYRSEYWEVPGQIPAGEWRLKIDIQEQGVQAGSLVSFEVKNSLSDTLMDQYGFWLDAPTLGGIEPQLAAEKGDAHNGMIRWGGVKPALHIFPENWVDVQWREGDYGLRDETAVRRFLLEEVGELGFSPARSLGPFERTQFKGWDAWRVESRGEMKEDQIEWMVFYAPEVNKTFAINTTVVLPPQGMDPHAALRESFAVFPEIEAGGVAPEPLPDLLPGPELLDPPLAARFQGTDTPIVLRWAPLKALAEDEYYEVEVDYYYKEDNPKFRFATRETELTLPVSLYREPNCHVFNWKVTLKRQDGQDDSGQPLGTPLSFNSLYRYLWWTYPPGEADFPSACPYTHLD